MPDLHLFRVLAQGARRFISAIERLQRCTSKEILHPLPAPFRDMSNRSSSPSTSTVRGHFHELDDDMPPFAVPHPDYYLEDGNLVIQVRREHG